MTAIRRRARARWLLALSLSACQSGPDSKPGGVTAEADAKIDADAILEIGRAHV